jgi:hypothetical protein
VSHKYLYDNYYQTGAYGVPVTCEARAHYVFANSSGTEIIVIKNVAESYGINEWSIEHIPVQ